MKKLVLAMVALAATLGPSSVFADRAQTLIGSTVVGATWQRPVADGSGLSGQPGPMRFIAQEFKVRSNTTCSIFSSQEFDGVIFLYRNTFNPNNQLNNYVAGNDDGPVGNNPPELESSAIQNVALTGSGNGTTYILVTTGFSNVQQGSFQNYIQCDDDTQPIQGSCGNYSTISSEKTICLQDRFLVAINNVSNHPGDGVATPVRTGTSDTSLFWFYNDRNWEVMIKVLNGCAINGHYWVFAGALTNQSYRIIVTDMTDQSQKQYTNPLGNRAAAVADTTAFPCL